MPRTPQPPRQSTDIRQASLIEAALRLAAQRSPADITTGDLAAAVGISQGAVFRHFSSKDAIWIAVIDWVSANLMERLHVAAQARNSDPTVSHPLAALQDVFIAHVDFVMSHPGVPRIVFQELQHAHDTALKAAVQNLMQQYRALVVGLLQSAKAQNLLAPGTDLPSAALLFLGSMQGLVMQSLLSGDVQAIARQAPGVFAIYVRGIAAKETP
jgi:TetR/AcrR family transcriptional regulator